MNVKDKTDRRYQRTHETIINHAIELCQVFPHKKRHPLNGCRKLLNDMQFIGVPQIQCIKAFGLDLWPRLLAVFPELLSGVPT